MSANLQKTSSQTRGPQRTTREDWIRTALDTLVSEGVDEVKVLHLAARLSCARSSFYWYFKDRADLLDSLLEHWQSTNTRAIVESSNLPATTINFALVNVFSSWVTSGKFDTRLDFAVRDWARRSGSVRRALDLSDASRLDAIRAMFERFDYPPDEAAVRARIVYYTQIGYNALDVQETMVQRMERGANYLYCMTGKHATQAELDSLAKDSGVAPGKA